MDTYRLWKNNRIDQEFTVGRDELKERFAAWLKSKGREYVSAHNSELLIRFFLTAQEGMSSTFEESDFVAFYEDMRPCVVDFDRIHVS